MEWVSSWIQGIIIAVIISTIIEMILPEGTSKKYIKVVIGIYILFTIVSPVINKLTGSNFRVSNIFDLDEYIETSKNNSNMQNQLSNQSENQIKEVYLSGIKTDIQKKVENKGYIVDNIDIEVENDKQYSIKSLNLLILKADTNFNDIETEETSQIVENVNEIKIGVNSNNMINVDGSTETSAISSATSSNNSSNTTSNQTKKESISSKEKKELKEYLSSVYEINTKKIFINE